jgi:hypothetical protein
MYYYLQCADFEFAVLIHFFWEFGRTAVLSAVFLKIFAETGSNLFTGEVFSFLDMFFASLPQPVKK